MARAIDRRLIAAGRGARRGLGAAVLLGFAAGIAVIMQAVLLARIVTAVAFAHASLLAVRADLLGLVGLFVIRAGLSFGAEVAAHRAAISVKLSLRAQLLEHLFALGPSYAAGERSADLAATLLDGVETLEPYLARYLPQMALVAMVPLAILAVVLRLDWISALILVVTGPVIPFFMVLIGYRAEAINQRQWQYLLTMSAHFLDAVQGITTLKLFGRARDEIALIGRMADEYRRVTMAGLRVAFLTSAALEFFASLAIALVAVLFGARLLHGQIGFFPAFLVLLLVPEFFLPLRGLATHYHARMSALAAARRIFDVLDTEPGVRWGAAAVPSGALTIRCTGLALGYEPGVSVLRGAECCFPAGTMTAIVGRSGVGKSSLVAAILGFVAPSAGMITINDDVALSALERSDWWARLAYVPQNPRLFAGSIAENVRLARPEADDAAVRAALAQARLLDAVLALPQGLATPIGEAGEGLSGGEIQRLALARAFLKDADVLILDEATAHLDAQTEAALSDAIADLARGRTAIVIAHRLATVRRAAQILVIEDGQIAETGTHAELLARGGAYAALMGAGDGAGTGTGAMACAI
jgi:ATP-binding cassette subfamily C protein CydD